MLHGLRPGGAGTGVDGGLLPGLVLRLLALGLGWSLVCLRLVCLGLGYAGLAGAGVRLMRYGLLLVGLSLLGERLSGGRLRDGLVRRGCLLLGRGLRGRCLGCGRRGLGGRRLRESVTSRLGRRVGRPGRRESVARSWSGFGRLVGHVRSRGGCGGRSTGLREPVTGLRSGRVGRARDRRSLRGNP